MEANCIGMAWYKSENFARLRAMFADGHKLPRTYDEWLAKAEEGRKGLEVKGVRVIRVEIDPDNFPAWCRANGKNLDANARMEYCSLMAYRTIRGEGGDSSH